MHYFVYIFNLEIINIQKILTLASQWPLKVVQIHMTHPVEQVPLSESQNFTGSAEPVEPILPCLLGNQI